MIHDRCGVRPPLQQVQALQQEPRLPTFLAIPSAINVNVHVNVVVEEEAQSPPRSLIDSQVLITPTQTFKCMSNNSDCKTDLFRLAVDERT